MPELKNPRWEKFCKRYVELGNGSEALRRAGYKASTTQVASVDAAKLLALPSIKERITQLKAKALFKMNMEREELAGFYSAAVMTPAGEITPNHPLCQSYEVSEKGTKVRMPDKVSAAQALARMAGWEAAQRVELTTDNPLTAYLRELRAKVTLLPEEGQASGKQLMGDDVSD